MTPRRICRAVFRSVLVGATLAMVFARPVQAQGPSAEPRVAAEAQGAQAGSDPILTFFRNTELSGFVDMYYSYNFNRPGTGLAQLRNFDTQHNAFSLNLAEVALTKLPTEDSRAGFRIDLDYGPTAALVNAFEPGRKTAVLENVQQAYVSYLVPGRGVQFDFGKFVTQHGAEVIETKDNWNYSRSLLFALAIPYYHTGARFTVPVNDKFSFAGYVVNGWNNVIENNTGKTVGLQATIKPTPSVTIVQNYMGGPEQAGNNDDWRHLSDTTLTVTATPRVSAIVNYDFGREKAGRSTVEWQGIAAYLKLQANDVFALVPRFEWLDDKDGFMTGGSQKVKEVTVTAEVKQSSGMIMRLEFRRDFSDEDFFLKEASDIVKNQSTFTIGFVYAFSSKAP